MVSVYAGTPLPLLTSGSVIPSLRPSLPPSTQSSLTFLPPEQHEQQKPQTQHLARFDSPLHPSLPPSIPPSFLQGGKYYHNHKFSPEFQVKYRDALAQLPPFARPRFGLGRAPAA